MSTPPSAGQGQSPPRGHDQPTSSRAWGYSRGWRLFTVTVLRVLLRLVMKHEWQGREYFPRTGGVILAPNHMSYADWPTVALFSDAYGHRFPVFMIKSPIFKVPFVGHLLYKVGELPVYRDRSDAGLVLRKAEEALRAGACVIVYPEGTATRDPDLWPMVGKTGAARLALTTGVPVIPIAHWGAQFILPYGSKRPHLFPRRTVRMVAGPAVDLSKYQGQRLSASTLRDATADIMADITALLATIRQQTPPAVPYDPAVAGSGEIVAGRTSGGAPAESGATSEGQDAPAPPASSASPASASPASASPASASPASASPASASPASASPASASPASAPAASPVPPASPAGQA
jgi:1-acyl-sn-glycerol-3-phosphate acyltransferase